MITLRNVRLPLPNWRKLKWLIATNKICKFRRIKGCHSILFFRTWNNKNYLTSEMKISLINVQKNIHYLLNAIPLHPQQRRSRRLSQSRKRQSDLFSKGTSRILALKIKYHLTVTFKISSNKNYYVITLTNLIAPKWCARHAIIPKVTTKKQSTAVIQREHIILVGCAKIVTTRFIT